MPCRWTEDDEGNWDTGCDEKFCFMEGGPTENLFKFCPYCGEPCYPVKYVEPVDDEEVEDE